MLFPIPTSHFPLLPSILPKAAINKTGPSWLLRSFRQHKRVRVVCGAAVEEDRRQIQSSTLPKRTSGTLTRQHYSTASIHSTPPPPPPLPLPVDIALAAATAVAAPLTPLALHTSASPTAPHCYGYRAKTARLLPESILKHEKVTLLLFLPPLAPHSFAIPQRTDSHPSSTVYTTKAPFLHCHLHTPSPARYTAVSWGLASPVIRLRAGSYRLLCADSLGSHWPHNRLSTCQHHPRLAEKQYTMAQGDQQVMRR
jgi:hypothetical protein